MIDETVVLLDHASRALLQAILVKPHYRLHAYRSRTSATPQADYLRDLNAGRRLRVSEQSSEVREKNLG